MSVQPAKDFAHYAFLGICKQVLGTQGFSRVNEALPAIRTPVYPQNNVSNKHKTPSRRTPKLSGRGNRCDFTPWKTITVAAVRYSVCCGAALTAYEDPFRLPVSDREQDRNRQPPRSPSAGHRSLRWHSTSNATNTG